MTAFYDEEPDYPDHEADDSAAQDARDERLGEARAEVVLAAAFPVPDLMLTAATYALARTEAAQAIHPAVSEFAVMELARMRPTWDALVALDDACDNGLSRWDPEFERLLGVVFGALHKARGTWPVGGAA